MGIDFPTDLVHDISQCQLGQQFTDALFGAAVFVAGQEVQCGQHFYQGCFRGHHQGLCHGAGPHTFVNRRKRKHFARFQGHEAFNTATGFIGFYRQLELESVHGLVGIPFDSQPHRDCGIFFFGCIFGYTEGEEHLFRLANDPTDSSFGIAFDIEAFDLEFGSAGSTFTFDHAANTPGSELVTGPHKTR